MNVITAVFLVIWLVCLLAHVINIGFCIKRWLPMRRGKSARIPFINNINRTVMWGSTIISYVAVLLFFFFFDASLIEKAKLFAIIILIVPVQPVGLLLICEYCFLFNQNRQFSSRNSGTGDGSLSQDEKPN